MNCKSTISVLSLFGPTLHTRQAAVDLLEVVQMDPCADVELDFQQIEYVSRSFADQFHADKLTIAESQQKRIVVINASEEVLKMLQAVARTQSRENNAINKLPVYRYTDWQSLEQFLLSV
jgi:hypothetical protein